MILRLDTFQETGDIILLNLFLTLLGRKRVVQVALRILLFKLLLLLQLHHADISNKFMFFLHSFRWFIPIECVDVVLLLPNLLYIRLYLVHLIPLISLLRNLMQELRLTMYLVNQAHFKGTQVHFITTWWPCRVTELQTLRGSYPYRTLFVNGYIILRLWR